MAIDEIHAGRTPGIAIGVVEDGRLVYARGFGFATLSPHVPMTPDTEFYVGGLTMQFTAAAILLLAQDGKLKLDDPVSKYVPEFQLGAGHHDRPTADANLRAAGLQRRRRAFRPT